MATNLVSSAIVREDLTENNYAIWSVLVKNYLSGQDLWNVVESTTIPNPEDEIWRKKNAMALHAIQISCGPDIISQNKEISSAKRAKSAWEFLANKYLSQSGVNSEDNPGNKNEYKALRVAVQRGDWGAAKDFLDENPEAVTAEISCTGRTALHIAVVAGHVKIVKELVNLMPEKALELEDKDGFTPLAYAARTGITRIAKFLVAKNKNLVSIKCKGGRIPVVMASAKGHKDMTRYLFDFTPREQLTPGQDQICGAKLLKHCITAKIFDVALDLLQHYPALADLHQYNDSKHPLHAFTRLPSAFPSESGHVFWQRICSCIRQQQAAFDSNDTRINIPEPHEGQSDRGNCIVRGIKQINYQKLIHVQARGLLDRIIKIMSPSIKKMSHSNEGMSNSNDAQPKKFSLDKATILEAVKYGIDEVIEIFINADPDLMWRFDIHFKDIILWAVHYRQEKIFTLFGFETRKRSVLLSDSKFTRELLRSAAMLAPSSQLDRISGAALQMQRELKWLKEVESIVPPKFIEILNFGGEKYRELFTEQHMNLKKEGEKYMKEAATSCTVVAALIVTIMFAAAFTVPGGTNGDTGTPIFLGKKEFMVFIISDAISLFSSSTSVLMFLGILTSRYAEDDFLKSLPRKLIIGLFTLFLSIATMMIAFCVALVLMLNEGQSKWVLIPVILLAGIPVLVFGLLQSPLLFEIFKSTCESPICNKKKNQNWYSK